jgi:dihydrofolate reductase
MGFTNPYPQLEQYVFLRSLNESPDPNVRLVTENSIKLVQRLKQQPGKDIWLCGGSDLATRLDDEIDELILTVKPLLLGSGPPLFSKVIPKTNLKLLSHKVYANVFMLLRYRPVR